MFGIKPDYREKSKKKNQFCFHTFQSHSHLSQSQIKFRTEKDGRHLPSEAGPCARRGRALDSADSPAQGTDQQGAFREEERLKTEMVEFGFFRCLNSIGREPPPRPPLFEIASLLLLSFLFTFLETQKASSSQQKIVLVNTS